MKKPTQHLIAEVARRHAKIELTIGIDLGDIWSHYCTLNQDGEVVDRGRFRTTGCSPHFLGPIDVYLGSIFS
jgi:hypothetical protein